MGCCKSRTRAPNGKHSVLLVALPSRSPKRKSAPVALTERSSRRHNASIIDLSTIMSDAERKERRLVGDKVRTVVNAYVMLATIGRGAITTVKEAVKDNTNEKYAIKVYNRSFLHRRQPGTFDVVDSYGKVMQEIEILSQMKHSNVIKLFEVINDASSSHVYLVFEYCSGGVLFRIGQDEPLAEAVARKYFLQVANAVSYLHSNRVIHRDLKPENFLLHGESGLVKVSDLGSAEVSEGDDDVIETTAGTPAFWAPELFAAHEYEPPRGRLTDVWALGVSLFAMLSGRLPFPATSLPKLQEAVCESPVMFDNLPLSEALLHALLGLLDKDASERLTIEQLLAHTWLTSS